MALSEIDICNLALGKLGQHFITSFADPSTEAQLCALNYPIVRDEVLESRDWTFATIETQLTGVPYPVGQSPEYAFTYAVPADCLLIRYCFIPLPIALPGGSLSGTSTPTSEEMVTRPPWNRYGDLIFTNNSQFWVRYIKRVTDTSQFDSKFVQALASWLASELAMPITSKVDLKDSLFKEAQFKIVEASGREGSQGTPQVIQVSTLTRARYGIG